ncbi:MAG: hypothetical protein JWN44_6257 [Myxococcales bacterium]|nr:hypothetical protein [Myxococcales bacterium]
MVDTSVARRRYTARVSDAHLDVTIDQKRKLVVATRGGFEVARAADITAMIAYAREAVGELQRSAYGMLVDLRKAPLSVESRFAGPLTALRQELTREFRRAAFLVETKMGLLQVQRFVREERLNAQVFDDYARALAHLAS